MKTGLKNTAIRMVNAETTFANTICRIIGCTSEDARKIAKFYLKNKLAKMDAVGGTITVKHGVFLEEDVLRNALAEVA